MEEQGIKEQRSKSAKYEQSRKEAGEKEVSRRAEEQRRKELKEWELKSQRMEKSSKQRVKESSQGGDQSRSKKQQRHLIWFSQNSFATRSRELLLTCKAPLQRGQNSWPSRQLSITASVQRLFTLAVVASVCDCALPRPAMAWLLFNDHPSGQHTVWHTNSQN